jgi:hypothetical protein
LTVNVSPAMVNVPLRAAPVFGAAVNRTEPSPLPLAPDVISSQGALVAAVHVQPALVDTFTGPPEPPDAATD